MGTKEVELNAENFVNETATGVVLVDFWAPWCGPCMMQGPILESVAEKLEGKARILKCNVDEAQDIAGQFGIQSIPTLIILKNGTEVDRMVGLQSAETLQRRLLAQI